MDGVLPGGGVKQIGPVIVGRSFEPDSGHSGNLPYC